MIRIPIGNEKSARLEVRSIAPDANPYMAIYTMLKLGLEGPTARNASAMRDQKRFLSDNIYDAITHFRESKFLRGALGEEVCDKFVELKLASADRCPRALGTRIKRAEVMFHHEVTNQYLWSQF
jgi:glutamine synthetase